MDLNQSLKHIKIITIKKMSHNSIGTYSTYNNNLSTNYNDLKLNELQDLCKERNIPNYANLKKYELIQLLNRFDLTATAKANQELRPLERIQPFINTRPEDYKIEQKYYGQQQQINPQPGQPTRICRACSLPCAHILEECKHACHPRCLKQNNESFYVCGICSTLVKPSIAMMEELFAYQQANQN